MKFSTMTLLLLTTLVAVFLGLGGQELSGLMAMVLLLWTVGGFLVGWFGRSIPASENWVRILAVVGLAVNWLSWWFVSGATNFVIENDGKIYGPLTSGFVFFRSLQEHHAFLGFACLMTIAIAMAIWKRPQVISSVVAGCVLWLLVFWWGFMHAMYSIVVLD